MDRDGRDDLVGAAVAGFDLGEEPGPVVLGLGTVTPDLAVHVRLLASGNRLLITKTPGE
jgi:hypothetical protein